MSQHFPSLAIPGILPRLDLVAEEPLHEVGDNEVVVVTPEVDADSSKELVDEVDNKDMATNMTVGEVVEVLGADDDLAGRIMTSRNATVMHPSTSSLIGRCWKKLISTVSRSSTWTRMKERILTAMVSYIIMTDHSTSNLLRVLSAS